MAEIRCFNCDKEIRMDPETISYSEDLYGLDGKFTCGTCLAQLDPRKSNSRRMVPYIDLGFNYGAFFLTPLWLLFNGKVPTAIGVIVAPLCISTFGFGLQALLNFPESAAIAVLVCCNGAAMLIPLTAALRYGSIGNQVLWSSERFANVSRLKQSQRPWNIAGLAVLVLSLVGPVLHFANFL